MSASTGPIPAPTGWYVVAKEGEVSAKKPLRCWIHDVPLVLYRAGGENSRLHRPLSAPRCAIVGWHNPRGRD